MTGDDAFTDRTRREAQLRLLNVRLRHRGWSEKKLAQMLAEEFTDWELNLLDESGFLSRHDKQVLGWLGRTVRRLARVS